MVTNCLREIICISLAYSDYMAGDTRATLRVHPRARNDARVTKAKLGLTWSEFLNQAADELDPDSSD